VSGSQLLLLGGTPQVASDPNFEYTTLLLPGNGTNGAQNNTFLDSSTNNFTITRNGNTTQGTFSPFSQTGWGSYFDGSGDYCTLSSNASMNFGTGNFTIECWVYTGVFSVSAGASRTIIGNSGNSFTMQLYIDTTSGRVVFGNTGSTFLQGTNTVADNQWHHVVVVRSGTGSNQIALFVDGNRQALGTNSQNYVSGTIYLGAFDTGNGFWNGYISNLRIVKGTAVYDPTVATLTVPTAPLTAVSNTALLTFQSNRFLDNSTNAYTVTKVGDTSIQAFSPFNPTAAWSASTNGGSGYFDGSGDYLSVADNAALEMGSSNFTMECWFYPLSLPADALIADFGSQGAQGSLIPFYCSSSNVVYYISSGGGTWNIASGVSFGGTLRVGQWHHLALVRNGNTYTPYFNGVAGTTTTNASAINDAAVNKFIGSATTGTAAINGYLSDFRVVKGTAVYTANFTPPTAPLTAITNTSLLTNFTNAGIYDATSKNDLETVGNAQISTAQSKFGGSSMYFDGTGDYLLFNAATTNLYAFGTGDFTVEAWVYITSFSVPQVVVDARGSTTGASPWQFYVNPSNKVVFNYGSNLIGAISVAANTWTHIAATRSGSTLRIFVNGILDSSATTSASISGVSGQPVYVGRVYDSPGSPYFSGYIDDLRITKGIARYTSNFTPPTAAFPLL
jgi:hypothetical protein